jgi:hypothetical protein
MGSGARRGAASAVSRRSTTRVRVANERKSRYAAPDAVNRRHTLIQMTMVPTPGAAPRPIKRYGIAVIANDKVLHWLLPLLESHRETNPTLPFYIIPYNDHCDATRRVAEIYGAIFADIDSTELDALSKKLFPLSLGKRFRLRKFLSLALPLDEVIYFDADIVLYRDLTPLLGRLDPGNVDFIVASKTVDYVYNRHRAEVDYLKDAFLFNDGFFITSNSILSIHDFYEAMEADEATFDRVRQRGGLYAQPLCNFVVHRKGLRIVAAPDLEPTLSNESYHKAQGVTFDTDGKPRDHDGAAIYFAHWAGVTDPPSGQVFDASWRVFHDRAQARVQAAR